MAYQLQIKIPQSNEAWHLGTQSTTFSNRRSARRYAVKLTNTHPDFFHANYRFVKSGSKNWIK